MVFFLNADNNRGEIKAQYQGRWSLSEGKLTLTFDGNDYTYKIRLGPHLKRELRN